MNFVEVIDRDTGHPIIVNTDHIIFVHDVGGHAQIALSLTYTDGYDHFINCKETYEEIRTHIVPRVTDIANTLFGGVV